MNAKVKCSAITLPLIIGLLLAFTLWPVVFLFFAKPAASAELPIPRPRVVGGGVVIPSNAPIVTGHPAPPVGVAKEPKPRFSIGKPLGRPVGTP